MNRGVNRNPIFVDDEDREYFRKTVAEYKELCAGNFSDRDRCEYGEALMSGVDEKVVRYFEGERAIGSKEFDATLKMVRGHYRVKRGVPAKR